MKKEFLITFALSCTLMAAGKSNPQRSPQQVGTGGIGKMSQTRDFIFNDITCKGKSADKRPVNTVFTGEMSNGKISNVYLNVEKNDTNIHRFYDSRSVPIATSSNRTDNYAVDLSDNDKSFKFLVEFPQSGKGRGLIQILEVGTKDVLSSAILSCRTKNQPSLREKNDLCISVAKEYAATHIKAKYRDGGLYDEEPQVEENKFTGVYELGFGIGEECINSITVKTKIKVLPNRKMSCEAYEFEFGDQECG